ncbi:MAG TPA: hypothetical protein VFB54_09695 [Burkholderiales bacterium]|nr:hypothetical protein [Burkholderiales bacterium]
MDLSAYDLREEFSLHEASWLWAELDPHYGGRGGLVFRDEFYKGLEQDIVRAHSWLRTLSNAAERGELTVIKPQLHPHGSNAGQINWAGCVVSRSQLREWAESKGLRPRFLFLEQGAADAIALDRSHRSDRLQYLIQAADKFWRGKSKENRAEHPDNEAVATWLINEGGYSRALAEAAATIIRPGWAAIGRRPDK